MEELGRNLAGETAEAVSEAAASAGAELRKRRSTRIVQAVPLVVAGVDALGRPFAERTSSLIINCHGCRYQSKHYVLKNMWVTLEIPHPEAGQPPRSVRGRVAWIQRPRTVRQLFQVALELEIPGNVWGIGFPPEDWLACSGTGPVSAAPLPSQNILRDREPGLSGDDSHPQPAKQEADFHINLTDAELPPASGPDNVRVFPSPASTTDASLQLARQVARLLVDAKQQIHAEVREAAAQAVSAERRIDAAQWEQKFAAAREEFSREVAGAIEKIQEESETRSRAAHNAASEALRADLPRWIAPQLEELTRDLAAQLSQEGLAQRRHHAEQLAQTLESLSAVRREAEDATATLRERIYVAQQQLAARAEASVRTTEEMLREREQALAAQQESLSSAANELREQISSTLANAQKEWQGHLAGEMEAAQMRLQIATDNALGAAQERAACSLNEQSASLVSDLRQEAERLAATLKESVAIATSEAEGKVAALRESLQTETRKVEESVRMAGETCERLGQLSGRLESEQQQAITKFQTQLDDVLTLHCNELHRRSEALCEEINARVRSNFEEAGQQAVLQFGQQINALVAPHIASAEEAVHRMAGGRSLLDAALAMQQERIRTSADEAFAEALAQFRGNLGSVEQLLHESTESVLAKNLSEFEGRLEEVKQQTVRDLLKSAEWYEKKAQTQMQSIAEKTSEQSGTQLREKAGEISSVFASELDHSSRNFVSHTQTQMEEVVRDSFDRARGLFAEAAETTSAAFIDEIQRHAREELGGFEQEVQKAALESRAQLDAARGELAQKVTIEQEEFLRRFQTAMSGALETGVAEANQRVQSGFAPLLESWKSVAEAHQSDLRRIYSQMGDEAAEQYRVRLENVSNQWMLATVTSLDHQSRDVLADIAAAAEEKLRDTCASVFSGIGDTLRERLRQMTTNFNVPPPPVRG